MIESSKMSSVLSIMNRETKEGKIKWVLLTHNERVLLNENEKLDGKAFKTYYKKRVLVIYKYQFQIQTDEFEFHWDSSVKLVMLDSKGEIDWEFPNHRAIGDLYNSVRFKVADVESFLNSFDDSTLDF